MEKFSRGAEEMWLFYGGVAENGNSIEWFLASNFLHTRKGEEKPSRNTKMLITPDP